MNIKDIKIGKFYRLKSSPNYGYVKPIEIFRKGQFNSPDKSKNLIKCEHTSDKNSKIGFIRYFKPSDLIEVV